MAQSQSHDFPLYNELLQEVESGDSESIPTNFDPWKIVIKLPKDHLEVFYAMIWHHAVLNNDKRPSIHRKETTRKISVSVYKGKVFDQGKGIIFCPTELPKKLQQILERYIYKLTKDIAL